MFCVLQCNLNSVNQFPISSRGEEDMWNRIVVKDLTFKELVAFAIIGVLAVLAKVATFGPS